MKTHGDHGTLLKYHDGDIKMYKGKIGEKFHTYIHSSGFSKSYITAIDNDGPAFCTTKIDQMVVSVFRKKGFQSYSTDIHCQCPLHIVHKAVRLFAEPAIDLLYWTNFIPVKMTFKHIFFRKT